MKKLIGFTFIFTLIFFINQLYAQQNLLNLRTLSNNDLINNNSNQNNQLISELSANAIEEVQNRLEISSNSLIPVNEENLNLTGNDVTGNALKLNPSNPSYIGGNFGIGNNLGYSNLGYNNQSYYNNQQVSNMNSQLIVNDKGCSLYIVINYKSDQEYLYDNIKNIINKIYGMASYLQRNNLKLQYGINTDMRGNIQLIMILNGKDVKQCIKGYDFINLFLDELGE
jgi:hypothetical protein